MLPLWGFGHNDVTACVGCLIGTSSPAGPDAQTENQSASYASSSFLSNTTCMTTFSLPYSSRFSSEMKCVAGTVSDTN